MKLLIFGLNYAPELTGTGKYTAQLSEWLVRRGHTVEVITGIPHYPAWRADPSYVDRDGRVRPRTEKINGVTVYRAPHFLPTSQSITSFDRIRLETSFSLSAARYWLSPFLSRHKPDVVIGIMPPMQVALLPILFTKIRRVPVVLHVQDLQVDAALQLNLLRGSGIAKSLFSVERFFLTSATRVSTISTAMRDRIIGKGVSPSHVWICPNWSDVGMPLASRENPFRRDLGVNEDDIVVLYSGNMGEKQGLDTLVESAIECRSVPGLYFVLVGDGVARRRLENSATQAGLRNIRFLPLQPISRMPEMLAAGDIHIVPQKTGAADLVMPSKLANILRAHRPCIVTAAPGTALYNTVLGVAETIPPDDAGELSKAILKLASDPLLRENLGQRAEAYAVENLDRDRILRDFEHRLQSLANDRGVSLPQ